MPTEPLQIVRCPADRRAEALALVLCELAPSARRVVAGTLLGVEDAEDLAGEPLYIARNEDGKIQGAAWGQRQSGNIALFWPPQFQDSGADHVAIRLAEAVTADLDKVSVELTQVFLTAPDIHTVATLRHVGFRHLADLNYLACDAQRFPLTSPDPCELGFVPYQKTQRPRLLRLIERTYENTLDCVALNGARDIDNVVNGYESTGVYRPENWLIALKDQADVGVLLLADHPSARHWELMYTGLVPEARGRGWGRQITRYAQWLARAANVERIVVAVDAANEPAVAMYHSTGFELWDRRAVYVRFPAVVDQR